MKILIKLDNSERSIPGGSSILAPIYKDFAYIARSPTDLIIKNMEIQFYDLTGFPLSFKDFDSQEWRSPLLYIYANNWKLNYSILDCFSTESKKANSNLTLDKGEIITAKIDEDSLLDFSYFTILFFCETKEGTEN